MKKLALLAGTVVAVVVAAQPAFAIEAISYSIFSALYSVGIPGAIANAISLVALPAAAVGGILSLTRKRK